MSRTGLTFDEFETAIKEIKAQGKSPTIKAIRDCLGKGSPNTIQRYLTEYKAMQTPNQAVGVQIPQALLQALQTTLRDASETVSAPILEELRMATENNELLAKENESLEKEVDSISEEINSLRAINEQLKNSVEILTAKEKANAESIESLKNSVIESNMEAIKAKALYDEAKKANDSNQELIVKQSGQIEELKLEKAKLEVRLDEKTSRLNEEKYKVQGLDEALTAVQAELKAVTAELANIRVLEARNSEIAKAKGEQVTELLKLTQPVQVTANSLPVPTNSAESGEPVTKKTRKPRGSAKKSHVNDEQLVSADKNTVPSELGNDSLY